MPATYEPIATTTLGSAGSVTFSSIPSTYTDLVLVMNGYNAAAGEENYAPRVQFNSDTGSNYSITSVYGDGASAGSTRASNATALYLGYQGGWSATSTKRGTIIFHIQNYSNTTTNKTLLSRSNRTDNVVEAIVGLWRSTAAINRMDISTGGSGGFAIGSTFTLYGIRSA